MYNTVVLGYIPGTNIQVSFKAWLVCTGVFVVSTLVVWLFRKRNALLPVVRVPLHASRLHVRLLKTAR